MFSLTGFELRKLWGRRSFLLSICTILLVNIFFLWYANLPEAGEPGLSAYAKLGQELSGMNEKEKTEYLNKLYQDMSGISHVDEILRYQTFSDQELGKNLADSEKKAKPGLFEKYYDVYQGGDYLRYTDSLEAEQNFVNQVWEEFQVVSNYGQYLQDAAERRGLEEISIFGGSEDTFARRNLRRSAKDYSEMRDVDTSFYPSKGIENAINNRISDLLLVFMIFLMVGSLISEERAKGLFYITRASALGRAQSMGARLAALAASCFVLTAVIYGTNMVFYQATCGLGELSRSVQSVISCIESCLHITTGQYLFLCVGTKAAASFVLAAFILLLFLEIRQISAPYVSGVALVAFSILVYEKIPAATAWNWLKYLNPAGLMHTEELYGGYVNFNFFGLPVSRLTAALIILFVFAVIGVFLCIKVFCRGRRLSVRAGKGLLRLPVIFKSSLVSHETYKVMIMNRVMVIILVFAVLLGCRNLSLDYTVSPGETYYQNMMLKLEGGLSEEKGSLIEKERERFEAAYAEIERIDQLMARGQLDKRTAEERKQKYYNETAFYPAFEQVLTQYEHVKKTGGVFVYDTGYARLLGLSENEEGWKLTELVLLVLCLTFAFSDVFASEHQKKSWGLLSATAKGRRKISACKVKICLSFTVLLWLTSFISYIIPALKAYPIHELSAGLYDLPAFYDSGLGLPIGCWLLLAALCQLLALETAAVTVLWISEKLGGYLQAAFVSCVSLLLPLLLNLLGISAMKWASLFPLFGSSRILLEGFGVIKLGLYVVLAAVIILSAVYSLSRGGRDKPLLFFTKRI